MTSSGSDSSDLVGGVPSKDNNSSCSKMSRAELELEQSRAELELEQSLRIEKLNIIVTQLTTETYR